MSRIKKQLPVRKKMQKIRVGVLMGGKSAEKEVSFNSGRTICDHLDSSRYEVIPLFQQQTGRLFILPWKFLYRGKISDFEHRLAQEAKELTWDDLKTEIDFVYLAIHGRYAEDGSVQGMLEVLNIPYLGSKVFASALGMDKILQKKFLQSRGIDVPRDVVITPQEIGNTDSIIDRMKENSITFPCIVKPHKEGSSLGMTVVHSAAELPAALVKASSVSPNLQQLILIEEKIEGMEFTCIILTDYKNGRPLLLPPTEVVPEEGSSFFDYEQKYMPGRAHKFTPARCSQEDIEKVQQTCLNVMDALDFENIARTDGFLTPDGRVIIIDPNSLLGMAPSSFLFRQAAEIDMNHSQLINHLIETELHRYAMAKTERTHG
jgi:D-alanine-D-alanine ligase